MRGGIEEVTAQPGRAPDEPAAATPPRARYFRARRRSPVPNVHPVFLRFLRLFTLFTGQAAVTQNWLLLFGVCGPIWAALWGYTAWVRRNSYVGVDAGGLIVRIEGAWLTSNGAQVIPPEAIAGFEVRRWFPPSWWLDLLGPRWVRPAVCLSVRLTDGGLVRLPMLSRPRWQRIPGPRVIATSYAPLREFRVGRWRVGGVRLRRWRSLRDASGRRLRWTAETDAEIVAAIAAQLEACLAFYRPIPEMRRAALRPDAPWRVGLWGFTDAQEQLMHAPEDGCRGAQVSAPLRDSAPGVVGAPLASFRMLRRGPLTWRPWRATQRVTFGRSGVTIREWALVATVPHDCVDGIELRQWRGRRGAWPHPAQVCLRLADGRYLRLPGFERPAVGRRRRQRLAARPSVLARWSWVRQGGAPLEWQTQADGEAILGVLRAEFERVRTPRRPSAVDPQRRMGLTEEWVTRPWDEHLVHLIDPQGRDGGQAWSLPG